MSADYCSRSFFLKKNSISILQKFIFDQTLIDSIDAIDALIQTLKK